jgi:hypothetical protein
MIKKMRIFRSAFVLSSVGMGFLSAVMGGVALAQSPNPPPGGGGTPGSPTVIFNSVSDITAKVCVIFYWLFTAAIIISVIMILWGAINYMIGGAEPEKIKTATSMFKSAVIGIVIAILAKAAPSIIASFLGTTLPPAC